MNQKLIFLFGLIFFFTITYCYTPLDKSKLNSIRITFDFTDYHFQNGNPSQLEQAYIKTQLINGIKEYFSRTIKINQLSSNLIIKESYLTHLQNSYNISIPTTYATVGVENTDFLVFLRTFNQQDDASLATATHILQDQDTNRPIVGLVNLNLNHFDISENKWDSNLMTFIHELTHAFVLSPSLYPEYIDSNGNKKDLSKVVNQDGNDYISMKTSKLVSTAKEFFNCSSITAVDLEDDGGSGSKGSHWERRYYYNEYMTATDVANSMISPFTLALYEDSGWYSPVYSQAQDYTYGKNKGCDFVNPNKQCSSKFSEFCETENIKKCSFNSRYKTICKSASSSDSFFSQSSSEPQCIIPVIYANGDCMEAFDEQQSKDFAEEYGSDSLCAEATIVRTGYTVNSYSNFCYQFKCEGSTFYYVINGTSIKCSTNNEILEFSNSNYGGKIYCPADIESLCPTNTCLYNCNRQGKCIDGQCVCYPGYIGESCQNKVYQTSCIESCYSCKSSSLCSKCSQDKILSIDETQCMDSCDSEKTARIYVDGFGFQFCEACPEDKPYLSDDKMSCWETEDGEEEKSNFEKALKTFTFDNKGLYIMIGLYCWMIATIIILKLKKISEKKVTQQSRHKEREEEIKKNIDEDYVNIGDVDLQIILEQKEIQFDVEKQNKFKENKSHLRNKVSFLMINPFISIAKSLTQSERGRKF